MSITTEVWWTREIVTDEAKWLGAELARRTGRPVDAFGCKGDTNHRRGAHRSQEWIKRSAYCTDRTYTTQAGLTADQERYCAGVDWTPGNVEDMITQSQRLMAEVRAGRLEEVRELYCNVDGDKVVDGFDNVRDRAASSDSSHLWHWHLTIDRRRLTDMGLMRRIADIATGARVPAQREDDDVKTLIRFSESPAVFLTDGVTARLVASEGEMADIKTLGAEGLISLKLNPDTKDGVRVVGRRELVGRIVGVVPEGFEALAALPTA